MANEITTTVVGNLTEAPELRFTPAGAAVVGFTVAINPRTYDRASGEWRDGDPSFMRCTAWRQLAENVAGSLGKGDRVVVTGRLAEERWVTPEGDKRSAWRLTADAVGAELTWATATVRRAARRADVAPDDPWATASTTRPEPVPAGDSEPPF